MFFPLPNHRVQSSLQGETLEPQLASPEPMATISHPSGGLAWHPYFIDFWKYYCYHLIIMNPARILVVEDDLFLRELYTDVLKAETYNVESAIDGEDALTKMKAGGYDLVLLDIIMPKMDGLEVMRRIKSEPPQTPNKIIIFLTNLDKDEEIKTALQLGDGYLIKSQINPGSLVNEVKNYLSKQTEVTPAPSA